MKRGDYTGLFSCRLELQRAIQMAENQDSQQACHAPAAGSHTAFPLLSTLISTHSHSLLLHFIHNTAHIRETFADHHI